MCWPSPTRGYIVRYSNRVGGGGRGAAAKPPNQEPPNTERTDERRAAYAFVVRTFVRNCAGNTFIRSSDGEATKSASFLAGKPRLKIREESAPL